MPEEIIDEFTMLNVSRQRKYQLRKRKLRKCVICGEQAVTAFHCETHRQKTNVISRESMRNRHGCKRRFEGAESYSFD
jgi:hypothetical protein